MELREAAQVLGVHYQTAYGWVRRGVLPARKVGRRYAIGDADVAELASGRVLGTRPATRIIVRDWAAQVAGLYSALVRGEEAAARRRFDRLADGISLFELCDHVLAPALHQIGHGWSAGRISIAQEHRASAICERLLAGRARQPAGRPRGTAVVATPPGERHSLPSLMAAACLREDRWVVHHLACDLPIAEIIRLASQVQADLVVLSSATPAMARQARQAADTMAKVCPDLCAIAGQPGDRLQDLVTRAAGADREKTKPTEKGRSRDR